VLVVTPRLRWEDIIKMDRTDLVFEGVDFIEISHDKVPLRDSVNIVTTFVFYKSREFFDGMESMKIYNGNLRYLYLSSITFQCLKQG
jgi:hypothetical protein